MNAVDLHEVTNAAERQVLAHAHAAARLDEFGCNKHDRARSLYLWAQVDTLTTVIALTAGEDYARNFVASAVARALGDA